MIYKITLKQEKVIVVLALLAFSLGLALRHISKSHPDNGLQSLALSGEPSSVEESGVPLPVRLRIPIINVDSRIDGVGVTPEGNVDVPKEPQSAAWFTLGPRPGEIGSSIIDGHSGMKGDQPAVFDDLHKLRQGDKLYVENNDGASVTFVVREVKTYERLEDVPAVFEAQDGGAHLNLITCTGDWNALLNTHSDRLVVFTDKE